MKHLYLIRHARAKRTGDIEDRQRPLSARGQRQAAAMAPALRQLGAFCGDIHVSSALRARQTLEALDTALHELDLVKRARCHDALYTFEEEALHRWLQAVDPAVDHLALIGHNPALLALAQRLSDEVPKRLPTGGLIHLALPIDTWHDLGRCQGEVRHTLSPLEASHTLFQRKAPEPPRLDKLETATRIQYRLAYQYRMIRSLEAGASAGHDPEFLHQYRVNLRRSRAVGEALKAILDIPGLKRALKGLRRHAQATSDLRDLEVMLDDLSRRSNDAPRKAREPIIAWLRAEAQRARQAFRENLRGRRYARDMQAWRELIDSGDFAKALNRLKKPQVDQVLHEQLARHDALLNSLDEASPDAALHRLRKQVKRIRYLAELAPERHRGLLDQLKGRQERLGEFQDLCTQLAWFEAFRQQASPSRETLQALRHWQARREERKAAARHAILRLGALASKDAL